MVRGVYAEPRYRLSPQVPDQKRPFLVGLSMYIRMMLNAHADSQPSIGDCTRMNDRDSFGLTFHPKYGYRDKKAKKPNKATDDLPLKVSITVNKEIMDALSVEIGVERV